MSFHPLSAIAQELHNRVFQICTEVVPGFGLLPASSTRNADHFFRAITGSSVERQCLPLLIGGIRFAYESTVAVLGAVIKATVVSAAKSDFAPLAKVTVVSPLKLETQPSSAPKNEPWPSFVVTISAGDRWVVRVLFGMAVFCLVLGVFVWHVLLTEIPRDKGTPKPPSVHSPAKHSIE